MFPFQTHGVTSEPSGGNQRRRRQGLSDRAVVRFFLWPTLILLIAMNIFPLIYSLVLSFHDFSAISREPPVWVGLKNFRNILTDEQLWIYFRVTGRYVVLTVGLSVLIGFGLAMLLRRRFRGSGIVTTLILIPMMMSPVIVGLFWKLIFNPGYGIFNYLLGFGIGQGPDWLGSTRYALWAIVIADAWIWSPFVMLIALAGLSAIPDYLYEAAEIDRASSWFQFWRITLPQVAPMLLIAVLFRTIEAFKAFDIVMGLTAGGPGDATELVAVKLYRIAFLGNWNTGKASALGYIMLVIVISVSNLYIRYLNRIREG